MDDSTSTRFLEMCSAQKVDIGLYGHIHHNEVFRYGPTVHVTTPSLAWNFNKSFGYKSRDWVKVDYGGYRVIHLGQTYCDDVIWLHGR